MADVTPLCVARLVEKRVGWRGSKQKTKYRNADHSPCYQPFLLCGFNLIFKSMDYFKPTEKYRNITNTLHPA